MTLHGLVQVGGKRCVQSEWVSSKEVLCDVPMGTGARQIIGVSVRGELRLSSQVPAANGA